jgi:hypothetical protein
MKKLLILSLAFGLLTACNNNKAKADKADNDKTEKEGKDNKDAKATDNTDNKETTDNTTTGWPQNKKDEFIGPCVDNAYKASGDRTLSETYCECMLNKLIELYPDYNKAEARGSDGLQQDLQPYIDGCAGRK